ncbi:TPA: sulfide/dihydroorotate dehydrogenase-like FAD/NAD-binding protein [bacterium]|nr:sulfide/dihydroorotate dehydrogenase-like FAD/NAD-binding protein [bacterium]
MFKILAKKILASGIKLFEIEAPLVARKALPGQFIVLKIDEYGERIPLTIYEYTRDKGTISIIFQEVGKSTMQLGTLNEGDCLSDIIGPLGCPTKIEKVGRVVTIGGGVGTAVIYPITRSLKEANNRVTSIIGARTRELLILKEEMEKASDELFITTDDGSYGRHGLVTDELKRLIDEGEKIDLIFAIGPVIMMKAVSNLAKQYNLKTMVSLNSIMVDGTGMCGCCRVTVKGRTKFVCVDGPDFEAEGVDFDELMNRQRIYLNEERLSIERYRERECRRNG